MTPIPPSPILPRNSYCPARLETIFGKNAKDSEVPSFGHTFISRETCNEQVGQSLPVPPWVKACLAGLVKSEPVDSITGSTQKRSTATLFPIAPRLYHLRTFPNGALSQA